MAGSIEHVLELSLLSQTSQIVVRLWLLDRVRFVRFLSEHVAVGLS